MRQFTEIREALDTIEAEMNRRDVLLDRHATRVAGLYLDTIKAGQQEQPQATPPPGQERTEDDQLRRDFLALYDAVANTHGASGDIDSVLDRWASRRSELGERA
jgi:hypothetical protein